MSIVLTFHRVEDPKWFRSIVTGLSTKFSMVSADQLFDSYHQKALAGDSCLITVDDGDATYFSVIYPILRDLSIPSVLFVSPQYVTQERNFWFQRIPSAASNDIKRYVIEKTCSGKLRTKAYDYPLNSILKSLPVETIERLLDSYYANGLHAEPQYVNIRQSELMELGKSDLVTLGAHTVSHPILANETDLSSRSQIIDSIQGLEKIIGGKVEYFAYPNGIRGLDFGTREMSFMNEAGVKLAFSTEKRKVSTSDNPHCIPRIGITVGDINYVLKKIKYCRYWDALRSIRGADKEIKMRKRLKRSELLDV